MITIVGPAEGTCVLCQKEKEGIETTSDQYGEAFFDWNCLRKITRLARPKPPKPTPLLERIENGR
jgi:hypothetical protein